MEIKINIKFNLEEIVFLITDSEQLPRIVTGIQIYKNGVLYRLANGTNESWHYDYEMGTDKNFLI